MFRATDPQESLLQSLFLVPLAKRKRMERSWAQVFHDRILPLIDEELFRAGFCDDNGRPNTSIRLLVAIHLLKAWFDLTDEQVLENVEFNLLWHYALGLTSEEAHLCQKTMHNFRVRLMENDRATAEFDHITKGLVEIDGLSVSRQRLDSTHVMSDIAVLTRLGLFVETVTNFLRDLKREETEKLESLCKVLFKRYLDREGYFSDAKREQSRRRLGVVAQDLLYLVRRFEGDEGVKEWESYQVMDRLLREQCDVIGGEDDDDAAGGSSGKDRLKLKEPKEVGSDSLQSPYDPDATYGHKGKGYEVQIAETCVEENPYQVVTDVEVNGAHESDQKATVPVMEKLREKELLPEVAFADTNYGSGENIVACAEMGVDLQTPVHDPDAPPKADPRWETPSADVPLPSDTAQDATQSEVDTPTGEHGDDQVVGLDSFRYNETFSEVIACPRGDRPTSQEIPGGNKPNKATFDGEQCRDCPFAETCPTRLQSKSGDRILSWRAPKAATETRQREQREPAFKKDYKIRSGIESTAAEFKGGNGTKVFRVRGQDRVELSAVLKALSMNVKRAINYHLGKLLQPIEPSPEGLPVEA